VTEIKDRKGRFTKGNPGGKLKQPVSAKNRAIAEVCRELWDQYGTKTAKAIFESQKNWAVKERLLEFIVDRGWGKAPQTVTMKGRIDPNSPEGILLAIAGQSRPGDDDESDTLPEAAED